MVKVTKPGAEEAVTVELGYDQKVGVDLSAVADEKLTRIQIGETLTILFDNKSTVTIHPYFDSMWVPLSIRRSASIRSTRQIRLTCFRLNSFRAFRSIHRRDSRRRVSLIPVIEPINGFPSVGSNVLAQLDDDALIGGIVGGPGDDLNAVNVTGILSHDYGSDGAGTTLLTTDGAILPVGFTASVNAEGTVLTIRQVSTNLDVLQISLSNTTDGSYTVTQLNPISHSAGGDENNLQFSINYVVTDGNGDRATGSFSIDVDDDTPIAAAGTRLARLTRTALLSWLGLTASALLAVRRATATWPARPLLRRAR